jgi:hypothetical protein
MTINSLISIDGTQWLSTYNIPAISLVGMAKWDGLTGKMTIESPLHTPEKISSNFSFGALSVPANPAMPSLPEILISPMSYTMTAVIDASNLWSGNSDLTSDGLNIKWQDGRIVKAMKFAMHSTYGATSGMYNIASQLTLGSLQLPASMPITTINDFKYSIALDNLDIDGIKAYKAFASTTTGTPPEDVQINKALAMLSKSSSLLTTSSVVTNLGNGQATIKLTFENAPKSKDEVMKDLNANIDARIAAPLVEQMVTSYLASKIRASQQPANLGQSQPSITSDANAGMAAGAEGTTSLGASDTPQPAMEPSTAPAANDAAAMAKQVIDALLEKGYLVRDKNDYVLSFIKKGNSITVNGKDMSDQKDALTQGLQQGMTNPAAAQPAVNTPVQPTTDAQPVSAQPGVSG